MKKTIYNIDLLTIKFDGFYYQIDCTSKTLTFYDKEKAFDEYNSLRNEILSNIQDGDYSQGVSISEYEFNEKDNDYSELLWERYTYKDHLDTELELLRIEENN